MIELPLDEILEACSQFGKDKIVYELLGELLWEKSRLLMKKTFKTTP